jgi:hypothetical protein
MESIVVQPLSGQESLHHWQTYFFTYDKQLVLVPISTVEAFKPEEGKDGVCTSLEKGALHILKSKQEFQLT